MAELEIDDESYAVLKAKADERGMTPGEVLREVVRGRPLPPPSLLRRIWALLRRMARTRKL